jgi:hypothetical protein
MPVALLILAAACALLAVVVALVVRSPSGRGVLPAPALAGKSVVVHTKRPDDQSIRGILVGQYADRWILQDAVYLHREGSVAAEGVVHVPVLSISSVQELAPPVEDTGAVLAPAEEIVA